MNFLNLLHQFLNSNYFLPHCGYFNNLFFDSVGVDRLIDESIHNLVVDNDDGFFGRNFDKAWHLHCLFANFLYLIDLGNFVNNLHYLVIVGCYLFDSLLDLSY